MAYTRAKMDAEIALIYRNPENWMWEASPDQPALRNTPGTRHVGGDDSGTSGQVHLPTIQQYCWVAYDKAFRAAGRQHIGRSGDLTSDLRLKSSNLSVDSSLLDDDTFGNILQMGKWANVVNDAWILGGINRVAEFELHSPRSKDNLWTANYGGCFVVTARELTGLLTFGYKLLGKMGASELYIPTDRKGATENANLEDYHLGNALKETLGETGGLVDIQNFGL